MKILECIIRQTTKCIYIIRQTTKGENTRMKSECLISSDKSTDIRQTTKAQTLDELKGETYVGFEPTSFVHIHKCSTN